MKRLAVAVTGLLFLSAVMPAAAQAQSYCREYNKGVVIGGRVQPGYGTACMQPDGAWSLHPADTGGPGYAVAPVYAAPQPVYAAPAPMDAIVPGLTLALNMAFNDDDHYYDRGRDYWRGKDRHHKHFKHDRKHWKKHHKGHHRH